MSSFEGNQFDCLTELNQAYAPLVKIVYNIDVSDKSIENVDRLANALRHCWQNNAYAIHRFCNNDSGWAEKNVEKLYFP